jgi:hypothetical protein
MYTVTGTALSGLDFTHKYESAQNAYTIAQSWIGFGFLNVALREDGHQWHLGPDEIRQFVEGVQQLGGHA